jgi:hypothetical protein
MSDNEFDMSSSGEQMLNIDNNCETLNVILYALKAQLDN